MKLKVIDVKVKEYEATFGTCEFCMSVGTAQEPTYEFEKEDGNSVFVEGYSWCWGDLDTIEVDNIIDFAEFVGNKTSQMILRWIIVGYNLLWMNTRVILMDGMVKSKDGILDGTIL